MKVTLEQATSALLIAIEAEDLGALAHAIAARELALQATPVPAQEVLAGGERACFALEQLKQRWAVESARLDQVRCGFGEKVPEMASLDLRG